MSMAGRYNNQHKKLLTKLGMLDTTMTESLQNFGMLCSYILDCCRLVLRSDLYNTASSQEKSGAKLLNTRVVPHHRKIAAYHFEELNTNHL